QFFHRISTVCPMATLIVNRLIVIWCVVLLCVNGVGVSSVTKRCVHIGEAIKLFSDTCKYGVSMYAINELLIASWSFKDNGIKIEHMIENYSKRIYMDGNRNVWFLDVERTDAGKYVFKCGLQIEQLDLELTVLKKLTKEQLQECPNKCPIVSEMDFGSGVNHHTSTDVSKKDDKEGVNHHTSTDVSKKDDKEGGCHSETDLRITAILVIVIIIGIFILVFMIMCIWFAYKWNKTKPLTENQVQRRLHDHTDIVKKNLEKLIDDQMGKQIQKCLQVVFPVIFEKYLDQQNSTEDHHTISSQVASSIVAAEYGIVERWLDVEPVEEEFQIDGSVRDKIDLFEKKCSPHEQPKLNKLQNKNVRNGRCFTNEDPDVHTTISLLKKEKSWTTLLP
ncbi:hypothetical protein CHS0354_025634, partial [Potamilus streckersoni]